MEFESDNITFTSSRPIYDFYVAGPYQTNDQVESMERLEKVLHDRHQKTYLPRFEGDINVLGPQTVFENRCKAIANSAAVIANYDDKDPGTIFAIGYAYSLGKPVYVYCEGLVPNMPMSVMVAQAATAIFDGSADLEAFLDSGHCASVSVSEY